VFELPDVEVLREHLASRVEGRRVREAKLLWQGLLGPGSGAVGALADRMIRGVWRKGALFAIQLDEDAHLVIDLAPWAWIWHGSSQHAATRTTALIIGLDDRNDVRIIVPGPRRTAKAWVVDAPENVKAWEELGPDPLGEAFTWDRFRKALRAGRKRVKEILTDPCVSPGLGDAYADEVLYAVGMSPLRYSHTLTEDEARVLWGEVPATLSWAVGVLRERTQGNLFEKEIRDFLQVHGKSGTPCPQCRTPIAEVRYDDRMTCYCPRCQRGLPRA